MPCITRSGIQEAIENQIILDLPPTSAGDDELRHSLKGTGVDEIKKASLQPGAGHVEFGDESLSESPDIIIINLSFLLTKHEKALL